MAGYSASLAVLRKVNPPCRFARVAGVDLRSVTQSDAPALRTMLFDSGVLVFPDQHLTPEDEVRVNRIFGYHSQEQTFGFGFSGPADPRYGCSIPGLPEVFIQGVGSFRDHFGIPNLDLAAVVNYSETGFHSDGVHELHHGLPIITSMYCHAAPERGGETLFADSRTAFQTLPEAKKALVRRLRVHYISNEAQKKRGQSVMRDGIVSLGHVNDSELGAGGEIKFDEFDEARGGAVHPLVRRCRDDNGIVHESIIVHCAHVAFMDAPATEAEPAIVLSRTESYSLIEELLAQACRPPLLYAHRWSKGDLVMWDNRLCLHSGPEGSRLRGQRLMHRVRLNADDSFHADCESVWASVGGA